MKNPHWNVDQSKDEKMKKKQPHRSDEDQQSTPQMGWENERVIRSDYRFSIASSFPYVRHAMSRNTGRGVIHGLEDQLIFNSGTEYAEPSHYQNNQIGGTLSSQTSHPTNSDADHGSQRNSQLYEAHVESGLNALSL